MNPMLYQKLLMPHTVMPPLTPSVLNKIRPYHGSSWHKKPHENSLAFLPNLTIPHLRCTSNLTWESSLSHASSEDGNSIINASTIVEPLAVEQPSEIPIGQGDQYVVELKDQKGSPVFLQKLLKFPMWLLGPSVLLATSMVPTLWLPLPSVFVGPTVSGLLSLIGLDCIFNIGATLFLLLADACAPANSSPSGLPNKIPPLYRTWNLTAAAIGFLIPLALLAASQKGRIFGPPLPPVSFAVLFGPYLLLLAVQTLTELLVWQWRSPVWLVIPVVYEAYRVLQLMRGITLAQEIGAPVWAVQSLRGMVLWWVLVLGVQLMRISWFAGQSAAQLGDAGASSESLA